MQHKVNHSDIDHSLTAISHGFIIFAKTTIFGKPTERAFDNPTLREYLKTVTVTTLNDLNNAVELLLGPVQELSAVSTISPNNLHTRAMTSQACQYVSGTISVLDVCGMNDQGNNQTERIDQNVPLASFYLLSSVIAAVPPFSVLTLWLSRIAALGVGLRPRSRRTRSRRRV
jgi:hypothetical protein